MCFIMYNIPLCKRILIPFLNFSKCHLKSRFWELMIEERVCVCGLMVMMMMTVEIPELQGQLHIMTLQIWRQKPRGATRTPESYSVRMLILMVEGKRGWCQNLSFGCSKESFHRWSWFVKHVEFLLLKRLLRPVSWKEWTSTKIDVGRGLYCI